MDTLRLSPTVSTDHDCVRGCTGWVTRVLYLFSYCRHVAVNRGSQRITVVTTWLWLFRSVREIGFDQVSRIICRGQGMPTLLPWRYLSEESEGYASAFFLISLALKDGEELTLFTIWEQQPREHDWLDQLAGGASNVAQVGDEASVSIVNLLHEYLAVPIARR